MNSSSNDRGLIAIVLAALNRQPSDQVASRDMEAVFADPQVQARGLRIDPEGIPGVRAPIVFSDADLSLDKASPKLGQDD